MAEYLTNDTDLTSIANAIRTKGGASAALTYPTGFVSAIEAIPTGGGGTSTSVVSTDAELKPVYYTDGNGAAQKATDTQAILNGITCLSKSIVAIFSDGPLPPGGVTVTGGTIIESLSLGPRATYKIAIIVQAD